MIKVPYFSERYQTLNDLRLPESLKKLYHLILTWTDYFANAHGIRNSQEFQKYIQKNLSQITKLIRYSSRPINESFSELDVLKAFEIRLIGRKGIQLEKRSDLRKITVMEGRYLTALTITLFDKLYQAVITHDYILQIRLSSTIAETMLAIGRRVPLALKEKNQQLGGKTTTSIYTAQRETAQEIYQKFKSEYPELSADFKKNSKLRKPKTTLKQMLSWKLPEISDSTLQKWSSTLLQTDGKL